MSIVGAVDELDGFRLEAESRMLDTFTAYAPTGTTKVDRMVRTVYTPQGLVSGRLTGESRQASDAQTRDESVGDSELQDTTASLHISICSPRPAAGGKGKGWVYVLTRCGPGTDPSLVGTRWRVLESPAKSNATARRLRVRQVFNEPSGV